MPDELGNLVPGDEGYIAPVETQPEVTESVVEAPVIVPDPPTQAQYDLLLAAYTKLKVRVGLDVMYEKALDKEAGL